MSNQLTVTTTYDNMSPEQLHDLIDRLLVSRDVASSEQEAIIKLFPKITKKQLLDGDRIKFTSYNPDGSGMSATTSWSVK